MATNPTGDTVEYTIPEPTQAEVDDIAAKIAVLDPDKAGITMNKLRVFYPKTGWGHILARLAALKAAGRVKSELRGGAGPVPFEYWTLTE